MRTTNYWLFCLWLLVAVAGALTLLGMFTIGPFVAPVALLLFVVATIGTVRRPGRVHSTLGALVPLPWAAVLVAAYVAPVGALVGCIAGSVLASVAIGVAFGVCEGRRTSVPGTAR